MDVQKPEVQQRFQLFPPPRLQFEIHQDEEMTYQPSHVNPQSLDTTRVDQTVGCPRALASSGSCTDPAPAPLVRRECSARGDHRHDRRKPAEDQEGKEQEARRPELVQLQGGFEVVSCVFPQSFRLVQHRQGAHDGPRGASPQQGSGARDGVNGGRHSRGRHLALVSLHWTLG